MGPDLRKPLSRARNLSSSGSWIWRSRRGRSSVEMTLYTVWPLSRPAGWAFVMMMIYLSANARRRRVRAAQPYAVGHGRPLGGLSLPSLT